MTKNHQDPTLHSSNTFANLFYTEIQGNPSLVCHVFLNAVTDSITHNTLDHMVLYI